MSAPDSSGNVDLSVVLPTRNGAGSLAEVLAAIAAQKTSLSVEVLAVDSGSTDGSVDLLRQAGARVHSIPPEEFSHSRTRNLGASLARASRYVVFLNQDAVPADELWLEGLVRGVEVEPGIRAVCAIELDPAEPAPFNVSGLGKYVFVHSFVRGTYVMEQRLLGLWEAMPKAQLRGLFPFTTVCALFDRDYFARHPFEPSLRYGEDLHWAVAAVRAGEKVACTSWAQVFHAPPRSDREYLARVKLDVDLGVAVFGEEYRRKYSRLAWAVGLPRVARWVARGARFAGRALRGF